MNLKVIDQPLASAQTQTQAAARGVTVPHGQFDIGDARTLIFEHQPQTLAHSVFDDLDRQFPPLPCSSALRASSLAAVTILV